jgi:hypothetical protein
LPLLLTKRMDHFRTSPPPPPPHPPPSPKSAAINSTDTVESFFDAVMYEKGGAVLRMLRAWASRQTPPYQPPHDESLPMSPREVGERAGAGGWGGGWGGACHRAWAVGGRMGGWLVGWLVSSWVGGWAGLVSLFCGLGGRVDS